MKQKIEEIIVQNILGIYSQIKFTSNLHDSTENVHRIFLNLCILIKTKKNLKDFLKAKTLTVES